MPIIVFRCAKVVEISVWEVLECGEKGNDLISGNHCTKPQTANSCSVQWLL